MAKAVLINPNNGAIDTRYDPNDIDDPFSYRARDGFMGIGPLWANNDDGTVYMQGHVVIPNPWGNVTTNGTTTTTTDDTTDKDGGDTEECCNFKDCCEKLLKKEHSIDYEDWMGEWDEAGYINGYERGKNGFECNEALVDYILAKCDYLYGGYGDEEDTKAHEAWQQRYYACVARWAGCKWATHPETFDSANPGRAAWAKGGLNDKEEAWSHGCFRGVPPDVDKKCEAEAGM